MNSLDDQKTKINEKVPEAQDKKGINRTMQVETNQTQQKRDV